MAGLDNPAGERMTHGQTSVKQVMAENIEDILENEDERRQKAPFIYRVISRMTAFCGTAEFLVGNAVFFAAWVLINQLVVAFDPFPYTFLLFAVSLEAIFLAIMILISQNMDASESQRRHHLDLQMDLLSERQIAALMRLMVEVARRTGVDDEKTKELRGLAHSTDPSGVLHQIVQAEHRHHIEAPGESRKD